jgi:hypothetical protein
MIFNMTIYCNMYAQVVREKFCGSNFILYLCREIKPLVKLNIDGRFTRT